MAEHQFSDVEKNTSWLNHNQGAILSVPADTRLPVCKLRTTETTQPFQISNASDVGAPERSMRTQWKLGCRQYLGREISHRETEISLRDLLPSPTFPRSYEILKVGTFR